jgi:hypothetical protein
MSSSRGRALVFLIRLAVFVLVFTALAEVWLRTVTPASEIPNHILDSHSQIFRFDPTGRPQGLQTVGRLAHRAGHWRVNNAGWISAVDYLPAPERKRPLVALFGDSYIEGLLTDVDRHVDSCLPHLLRPAADAYAFGGAGWYLEQYVATSRYASSLFHPDVLVIFLNDGDVADSVRENGAVSPYMWQISAAGGRFAEVAPTAIYRMTSKARLAKQSAIVRYLRYNALLALPGMQNADIAQPPAGAAGASHSSSADAWRRLLPAANYMVGVLCAQHPGTPIVFVSHSDRYLPVEAVSTTPLFADALAVQAACKGRPQCHFLDLRLAFSRDWAAHHRRFEGADGAHWNAYANLVVARALADFIMANHLLDGTSSRVLTVEPNCMTRQALGRHSESLGKAVSRVQVGSRFGNRVAFRSAAYRFDFHLSPRGISIAPTSRTGH